MRPSIIFAFGLLLGLLWQCQSTKKAQGTMALSSFEQRSLPEDLIFVPGAGHIAPFYVSIQEETNANYRLYLQWLQSVYGDSYPEVYQAALPKPDSRPHGWYVYNDPYLDQHLAHPSLANYPVVGLNWMQIQDYLRWKTDRLNEAVLINEGFLNANWNQKDEDNFNTEAFLFEQYQGNVRKNLPDEKTGGERPVRFTDGLFYAGFRLPTEAEWDYLAAGPFQKVREKKTASMSEPFPYADDHYLKLASWSETPLYQDAATVLSPPVGTPTIPTLAQFLKKKLRCYQSLRWCQRMGDG